ncbi:MAG TPA: aldehyde dehydrogenase family protein [Anaerolineales bacterium]|nr:aldehyde dehydrogenase family protein [Anaerolineales bacterium]
MFINGEFSFGFASEAVKIVNPATEDVLGESPRGDKNDALAAIEAARQALPGWKKMPASERAAFLHQVAANMRDHHQELVRLLTQEEGKPISENDEELWWSEETFDYYAELGRHERGYVIPPGDPAQFNFVIKEPWGVVACVVPWNYPLLLMAWKVAPALAAGNTVIIKPSELTPLTTLKLAELAFSHLPAGVVNVVTGFGPEVGEPLVTHPDVNMVAFTGSLVTGQRIASLAAPQMKKLHLELGGKDPMVIAPDVDLATAVSGLAYAALLNSGQVCTSTERVYVHESIYPQFTEELAEFVSRLRLGNGLDEGTDIGPMIRPQFREKVISQVEDALNSGAKVVWGGKIPPEMEKGYFFQPTILVDVDHNMRIMRDETFGPLIPLMQYRDFSEAIELANDCQYGLGATLMTHDARLVKRFYEEVQAGTIWINDPLTDNFAGPFGGMKMSGLGRELGQEGFDEFCQVKHVHWDVEGGLKEYWYPY